MKTFFKPLLVTLLFSSVLLTSCRTEEIELINAPEEENLVANSVVANLMQRTATNDGSNDNIIDLSNCFNIQLPVTVIVNGITIDVVSDEDYQTIEDIYDEYDSDDDTLTIVFPITIILTDFTEVVVNSIDELNTFSNTCNGENESDDDIECIDFQYPITVSIFNSNSELLDTIIINNDNELYDFLNDIDEDDIVNVGFPITVILYDETQLTINSLDELESTIEMFSNDCDEDDDYDWNDDDCDDCTTSQLESVLTGCSDWRVDKMERNDSSNDEDYYVGYVFNFLNDGTVNAEFNGTTFPGTWSVSGSENNIIVTINIPSLPDCNNSWLLHEIEVNNSGETKVDLRLGDDRFRYESDCSTTGVDDTDLVQALTTGDWYVTYFFDTTDQTTDFNDFLFNFASNGNATATNTSNTTNGIWSTSSGDETPLQLNLNFGTGNPLYEIAEDWDVLEATNDIIRLKDVSGGDGSVDFLTFERTQVSVGNDLANILADGLWVVASYTDDEDNETADYNGYQLNFNIDGTVIANNGTTINGTWSVQNSGNILVLNFGSSVPFDEFNDDWDVISVSDTQVIVQDVSGGNGGTDILTLQKL